METGRIYSYCLFITFFLKLKGYKSHILKLTIGHQVNQISSEPSEFFFLSGSKNALISQLH